jgi:hypothetical protein
MISIFLFFVRCQTREKQINFDIETQELELLLKNRNILDEDNMKQNDNHDKTNLNNSMFSWLHIFNVVIILVVIIYSSFDVLDLNIVRIQCQIQKKSTSILSIVY